MSEIPAAPAARRPGLPLALLLGLVAVVAAARLLPHPPNLTPVIALALFCGAALSSRMLAIGVTLAVMLLTDLWLGWHESLLAVYAALAVVALLGHRIAVQSPALRIAGHGLAGALVFFVLSNLAVWAFSGMYAHSLEGLWACYLMALPFFGNTLAGTALYGLLLFAAARRLAPAPARQPLGATA